MKKTVLLFLIIAFPLLAGDLENTVDVQGDWSETPTRKLGKLPQNWTLNSKYEEGAAELISTGEGYALELRGSENATRALHLYNRDTKVRTEPGAKIVVKVTALGRGGLMAVAYLYDGDNDSVGTAAPVGGESQLENEKEFAEFTFELLIPPPKAKHPASYARIALTVAPGSHIQIKSVAVMTDIKQ